MVSIPRFGSPARVAARPIASPRGLGVPGAGRVQPTGGPAIGRALPEGWALLRQRLSRLTVMTVALLVVGTVGLFQVLQTTHVAATGYDVSRLERERTSLDADIRLLEAQIATTSNLEQLRAQATKRLGMVPAQQQVHVTVDTPSPSLIPLPRRYVPVTEHGEPQRVQWWERVQAKIPGLH
jgi:hypothetical protein